MNPWFEDAMDLLSTQIKNHSAGSIAFRKAASVLDDEFSRISTTRKPRSRLITQVSEPDIDADKESEFQEIKKKLEIYRNEIFKLQAANADLTQVNKRWHRYNADMQTYIDRLQATIRDQQEQINNIGEEKYYSKERNENSELGNDCKRLREEVKRLNGEIEHLQFQVKSHKDDWEVEKIEKHDAIKERDDIQQRLNTVLRDMCINNRRDAERKSHCSESRCSQPCGSSYYLNQLEGLLNADENVQCNELFPTTNITSSEDDINERYLEGTACSLRPRDETYSHAIQTGISPCSSNGSVHSDQRTISMGIKSAGNTVTSFFQMPIVKSSSAPDRQSAFKKPPKFVNSISLSLTPPKQKGSDIPKCNEETQTQDDTIRCSYCDAIFPSDRHLKFADHLEKCQRESK